MKKGVRLSLVLALLGALPVPGRPGMNVLLCLGEAHYMHAGDMGGSTTLPQVGFTVEYRTRPLSLFASPTVGYYYGWPVLEAYAGAEVGWDVFWARPALSGGIGVQSYSRKDFLNDGDDYRREHEVRFPIGIGFRLWLFQACYGEWQGRLYQEGKGGVPMWKMEFGYKLI
jgi:hypothetical protein